MKLIVGLGNKDQKYKNTRHNIGFEALDQVRRQFGFDDWKLEKKFFGKVVYGEMKNEKAILLKPETYMNESGKSIAAVARFYKIPIQDVWVFFDDVDLPFGTVRLRRKGQSGGHNGIKSIIQCLGSSEFPRIKIGISNALRERIDTADFVLAKFSKEEQDAQEKIIQEGIDLFLKYTA